MTSGVFVTGTDTGVGKTHFCATALQALGGAGWRAAGMKPVASGCTATPEGWRNADALALQACSSPRPDYALVNPYALAEPVAPLLAARLAGVRLELARLDVAFERLGAGRDVVLVEGVGGWAAPVADHFDQAALARRWQLPVLLVVGLRLGCISHAVLSAAAIRASGLRLLGWVANAVDASLPHRDATIALLQDLLGAAPLTQLPPAADTPHAGSAGLAGQLLAALGTSGRPASGDGPLCSAIDSPDRGSGAR